MPIVPQSLLLARRHANDNLGLWIDRRTARRFHDYGRRYLSGGALMARYTLNKIGGKWVVQSITTGERWRFNRKANALRHIEWLLTANG
jgi:hypothetical protein